MNTQGIIDKIQQNVLEAETAYREQVKKHQDAADKENWEHWLQWNSLSLVQAQKRLKKWETLLSAVEREVAAGKSLEDVLDYLSGVRDSITESILTVRSGPSTNPVANLLEDIEQDVLRLVVGANCFNQQSLTGIIHDARNA